MNARLIPVLKLAALAAVLALPFLATPFYTELAAKMLIFAIFAMSLDLLVGFTGLVSFGHAAYFGIAAYTVAFLTPKYDPASLWLVLPAAMLTAAGVALLIGFFVLRTRGIYFIMVTLAFAQMAFYVFIVALLALVLGFLKVLLRSSFGRALAGIRSNEQRMQSLGYATFRYKLAAFAIAGG